MLEVLRSCFTRVKTLVKPVLLAVIFVLLSVRINAQLVINVEDASRQPIIGAMLNLIAEDDLITPFLSNMNGQVIIDGKRGAYLLNVHAYPYEELNVELFLTGEADTLDIILVKSIIELDEYQIKAKQISSALVMRSSLYSPEVIDSKMLEGLSKTAIEAIQLSTGVRIQQQGGIGSHVNINLNGIDGKDVKIFIDEIPLDMLGSAFEMQNLSLSMIERLEVYKGLIPVRFGSDALGGVINIVTKNGEKDFITLGYSLGSWNTHEINLNASAKLPKEERIFVGFDALYRHSDNDYWMDEVDVVIDDLYNTEKGAARRFNDAYDFVLSRLKLGAKDLSWADKIELNSFFSYGRKEWQHGLIAIQPWGEAFSLDKTTGTILNWKKSSSASHPKKWQFDMQLGYNFEQRYFEDISSRTYFWGGTSIVAQNPGESGLYSQGRTPRIDQHVFFARHKALFRLGKNHKVNINLSTAIRDIRGEDKAGTATYKEDPFEIPQLLGTNFAGLSLESSLANGFLRGNTSVKYYHNRLQGADFKINNEFGGIHSASFSNVGFGQAFKWTLNEVLYLLPGYEYTIRQADSREVFGDFISVRPNPRLKPARSHNINIKLHYKSKNQKIFAGIGGFSRQSNNRIVLSSFNNALAIYSNLLQTFSWGGEGFIDFKPTDRLELGLNTTYQDIRLWAVDELGFFTEQYIGARLPNIPYFFSNARLAFTYAPDKRNSYWRCMNTLNYVHDYFFSWEINGLAASKVSIPRQLRHDISLSLHPKNERWSFSIDCKNIWNARLYDAFSVQRPGRSIYAKINFLPTFKTK